MNRELEKWHQERLKWLLENDVKDFWYFAYIENLDSILKNGILPKNRVVNEVLNHNSFAEESVQYKRHDKTVALSKKNQFCSIHDLVPLYFCPLTPTLSARREYQHDFFMLRIDSLLLLDDDIQFVFTGGNAASDDTKFFNDLSDLHQLPWDVIRAKFWTDHPDGKRKRCSEFLIHPSVPTSRFVEIGVITPRASQKVDEVCRRNEVDIKTGCRSDWFF